MTKWDTAVFFRIRKSFYIYFGILFNTQEEKILNSSLMIVLQDSGIAICSVQYNNEGHST